MPQGGSGTGEVRERNPMTMVEGNPAIEAGKGPGGKLTHWWRGAGTGKGSNSW